MIVNRETLLRDLETIAPGLSSRDIIEQSSCFVFKNNRIYTYNDEICCSIESPLSIEAAVIAEPMLAILRRLTEEQVEISVDQEQLVIKGKARKACIRMYKEVLLPVDTVEVSNEWRELPEGFLEAVKLCCECASKDESQFILTCVHIHPNWIEACDNQQAGRYHLDTGFTNSVLVRRDSLKNIVSVGVTEVGLTENWLHFKSANGLTISCRRYVEQYPDLNSIVAIQGQPIRLPKGLIEAAENAKIFSSQNVEDDTILLTIEQDRVKVEGEGANGRYKEVRKASYNGKGIRFRISPSLLQNLLSKHHECFVSTNRISLQLGKFNYVTVTTIPDKQPKETE